MSAAVYRQADLSLLAEEKAGAALRVRGNNRGLATVQSTKLWEPRRQGRGY